MNRSIFQCIPSVDASKKYLFEQDSFFETVPQDFLRTIITAYWDRCRKAICDGRMTQPESLTLAKHGKTLKAYVHKAMQPRFMRVLNATGVVVHTNMGRSELCPEARDAVLTACEGYSNLELDLTTGLRGSRYTLIEDIVTYLTGAESCLVVNNNAAAVLLMLDTFCHGKQVVVSRGELVEIGGSFRIPEVMAKSGAFLREVGATNRTHLEDYKEAITEDTAALMRVHTSNYRIVGFHEACALPDLARLAHDHNLLLLEDLGSGSLVHFHEANLPDEPTVQEAIAGGADVVSFSGDKVLGGPQAGILVGKKACIDRMKKNQLTRALRCDKLCLAALEATLRVYIDPDKARKRIPTLRRIFLSPLLLKEKARNLERCLAQSLGDHCRIAIREDVSRVGGGAFPQYDLPTWLVCLMPTSISATTLKRRLLETTPPLIGRLEDDAFCLDPRTLEEDDFSLVGRLLSAALTGASSNETGEVRF